MRRRLVGGAVCAVLLGLTWPIAGQDTTSLLSTFLTTWIRCSTGGHLLACADNTYDIGANGANRPANIWVGTKFVAPASGTFLFVSRAQLASTADGVIEAQNNAGALGVRLQFAGLPTFSSGFGTSPSVVAGSLDTVGTVNVGTGGAATSGVINFATTWTTAPHCQATVETSTGANARTHGVTASTTQLTITASAAWVASSIVNWICVGAH